MANPGKARVLTKEQQQYLFEQLREHRYPEKNTAIMQISFKLGLRAQEIALLKIKDVAQLMATGTEFKLFEILSVPKGITKGANAVLKSSKPRKRTRVSFSIETFEETVEKIAEAVRAGKDPKATDFLPEIKERKGGNTRDLPMVNQDLRAALKDYLAVRIEEPTRLKPGDPLFKNQKGGPYSPNTLQEHMRLMLRVWAGIEKASSHSGRRTVITQIIHEQHKPISIAQQIAGHKHASTTVIYEEPPEESVSEALEALG